MAARNGQPDTFDFVVAAVFGISQGVVNALGGVFEIDNLALSDSARWTLSHAQNPHFPVAVALRHDSAYLGGSDFQSDVNFFAGHQFFLGLDF
jgi:hypothetical protein